MERGTVLHPTSWILEYDYEVKLGSSSVNWESPDGWLSIKNGIWKIKAGFRWDGCSDVPDFLNEISVETGKPSSYYASLCHDVGYRCLTKYGSRFPYSKFQIDCFFLKLGIRDGFKPIWIYFFGVLLVGWYYILTKKTILQEGE